MGKGIINMKFKMSQLAESIKKEFKDSDLSKLVGSGSNLSQAKPEDFLIMPKWWQDIANVPGLPYKKMVMIAGETDSGKTTASIVAMKAAQEQDVGIIYVETEGKTTEKDLVDWGVDPEGVLLIQSSIAEEAFELLFVAWDKFVQNYPNTPLLVIIDSIGNVLSKRDSEIDLTEENSKPGGKGKINRLAINKMMAKRNESKVALLIVNYTYDNIGSVGKTNAGGKALNLFASLIFQTSRKGWYERTVNKQKVRSGVLVSWKLYKNHLDRSADKKKEFTLKITSEGVECLDE